MRTLVTAVLLATAGIAIAAPAGRDRGPGVVGERVGDALVYRVAGFDAVSVGTAGTVDVTVGPAFAVRAGGAPEALANLRVVRVGNSLEIGRRFEGRPWTAADRSLRIAVTLPRLAKFAFGGAGSARIDRVRGDAFEAAVGGSGAVTVAELAVGKAEFALGGSGDIVAAGSADDLALSVGGSGRFRGERLRARTASVSVGGSGSVRAMVDGPAQVSAVGSGTVDLGAAARCRVSRLGSARVRCGG